MTAAPGVRALPRVRLARGARAALRRVPAAAWTCALIAALNACAWSIITPPFQGKDEVDHFSYVARLAEAHALPEKQGGEEPYPAEELHLMEALDYYGVRFTPFSPSLSSTVQQQTLAEAAGAGYSLKTSGEAGRVDNEAPLYYALEVIPYELGGANPLTKLQLMRLFDALLAAITALLSFFFLRELLPRVPWAATVGALCVALQPLFGFMSGSINPDVMLYTVCAALLLCLARAFRRGLSPRLAVALGALTVVGFLTKLNFIGFVVGVFIGLIVLAVREARRHGRRGLLAPAIAGTIGIAPAVVYVLHNVLSHHAAVKAVSEGSGGLGPAAVLKELSYTWQMFLPRLPGMTQYFKGMFPLREVWFDRSVGLYGWMDTMFPPWVDNVALVLAGVTALLCGRELYVRRRALRARLAELCVYASMLLGLLLMIGFSSYHSDLIEGELSFGEPRYLLPLIPLLGAAIVLAVRGAGRRWAPVVGAAFVILFLGHDLFSQLQVIARYYG
jgi:4-amino-4-deoxy-L-arabinose transferase-like glycosyltransferase